MKRFVSIFALLLVLVLLSGQAALAAPPPQGGGMVHYVREGESLYGIAAQYGVSAEAIMRQNGLMNPDLIYAGQALVIPGGANGMGPMNSNSGGHGCADYYTVQMGDTLSGIAWRSGTTTETLLRLNNLHDANFVFVGQRLCMPVRGYMPQPMNYAPAPGPNQWHRPDASPDQGSSCDCDTPNCGGCGRPAHQPERPRQSRHGGCDCDGPDCKCPMSPQPGHDSMDCDGPNSKCPPDRKRPFELWFDRKEYEEWHKPANGLTQCSGNDGPFDIVADPIQRITVAVFLSSDSPDSIPSDWAASQNVLFHTAKGFVRQACVWTTNTLPSKGGMVNVTFYTHLDKGDSIKDVHFNKLKECLSPNNGMVQPCDQPPDSVEGVVLPPFPDEQD